MSLLRNAVVTIYSQVVHRPSGIKRFWFGCHLIGVYRVPRAGLEAWLGIHITLWHKKLCNVLVYLMDLVILTRKLRYRCSTSTFFGQKSAGSYYCILYPMYQSYLRSWFVVRGGSCPTYISDGPVCWKRTVVQQWPRTTSRVSQHQQEGG